MIWVIIILAILVLGALSSTGSSQTSSQHTGPTSSTLKPYKETKLCFNVKGIWVEKSRIDEFKKLRIGDIVYIKIDTENEYDQNALGVYSKQGVLLGYIKRNQRKLIKSVRENIPKLVKVIDHEEFYSQPRQLMVYRLSLEIWIGYPQEILAQEEENFVKLNSALNVLMAARQEVTEIRKNLSVYKKSNPESTLTRLDLATKLILEQNPYVYDIAKEKIPFLDYINVAYSLKDYQKLINYFTRYISFASVTDLQMQSINKKIKKAQMILATREQDNQF